MIILVSTVSLSAVFPLCLVRLVGGGREASGILRTELIPSKVLCFLFQEYLDN